MRKRVFAFSSIGAAAIVVAGALFWTFYYAEILRIRDLSVRAVDLTRVPSGRHSASFETPYKSYHVSVVVEAHAIRSVQVTPSDDFMAYFDRKGLAVADQVVLKQRTDVDAVSGATVTSKAVLKAIEKALVDQRKQT
jgi:uncharacterized protein with FMN-binding domain